MRFERLGWIVAAALVGGIAAVGFQDKTEKTGTVDLAKVFNESEFAKSQTESLRTMGQTRQGIIDFVRQNPHMPAEDATKFRDLSVKDAPTAAEKADIERIKKDAQTAEQTFRTLSTKDKPTPAELSQLEDFNRRKDGAQQLLEKWNGEFANEIQAKQESLRNDTLQRAKDAVGQVAKAQGFTMVFVQDVAPYSAHDLTADALKAMNGKK